MFIINNFFQICNLKRHATDFVDHKSFLLLLLILRLESLLVLNELLLHQYVVFDSFLSQKSESALRGWENCIGE